MWCFFLNEKAISQAGHAAEITQQVSPHHLPSHLTPLCSTITHHNEQTQNYSANQPNDKGLMHIALSSLLIQYLEIKEQPFLKLTAIRSYVLNLCFCVLCFYIAFMYIVQ